MSAIEIYEKVIAVLCAADYEDSSIALEFAQRKINNLRYAAQGLNQANAIGGATPGSLYAGQQAYVAKQVAAAREEIVKIVREEMATKAEDAKEVA